MLDKACGLFSRVEYKRSLYVVGGLLVEGSTGLANPSFAIESLAERWATEKRRRLVRYLLVTGTLDAGQAQAGTMNVDRLIRLARALALAAAVAVLAVPAVAFGGPDVAMRASGRCTMAMPAVRATVEVEIVSAADFCELVSQALAGDVFRSPVLVTPGLLWHYADATLSCRLRYGTTRSQVTIRNSAAACRWFTRLAAEWRAQTSTTAYAVWRDVARGGAG